MPCCDPIVRSFYNQASLDISYGAPEIAVFGPEPNVQVFYLQGSEYVLSDDQNNVSFNGSIIHIDFGGPNIGYIKIF